MVESDTLDTLVIIAGASRGIGAAFKNAYEHYQDAEVIAINRTGSEGTKLNVSNETKTRTFVEQLDLSVYSEIIYIHSIGIDKFEPNGKPEVDQDGDGIDDEIYATNYLNLRNMVDPLLERTANSETPLTICAIGSISDVFMVPYWKSFSHTKNEVRKFFKSINARHVKRYMLNVGRTVDPKDDTYIRKYSSTGHFQTSNEFVAKAIPFLEVTKDLDIRYFEGDFFKHDPNHPADHFTNLPRLYREWQDDLGYTGKKIPEGLRL